MEYLIEECKEYLIEECKGGRGYSELLIARRVSTFPGRQSHGFESPGKVLTLRAGSDAVLDDRILHFMESTPGIPLGFYKCPVPYKRVLSAMQLGKYAASGRIVYHKDTSLDLDSIIAKLEAGKDDRFKLYDAYMGHAVKSLKAGSAGLSCIQGNYFPELIVWLCNNFDEVGLQKEVDKVQDFLIENMGIIHTAYPLLAKYFLQMRGLPISTYTRREVGTFTEEIKVQADQLYTDYEKIKNEIGINGFSASSHS